MRRKFKNWKRKYPHKTTPRESSTIRFSDIRIDIFSKEKWYYNSWKNQIELYNPKRKIDFFLTKGKAQRYFNKIV